MQEEVIKAAKEYAADSGRSLSDIVENYLKSLKVKDRAQRRKLSPKVKKLKGIITLPDNFDYKKTMAEEVTKKYRGR